MMREKLVRFEEENQHFQPSSEVRNSVYKALIKYSESYLEQVDQLPVYNVHQKVEKNFAEERRFDKPISFQEALEQIRLNVDAPGLNPPSRGQFGYIPGGNLFYSIIADFLAALTDKYAGVRFAAPGAAVVEDTIIHWMSDLFGFPENTSGGALLSGGSLANLTAIAVARDAFDLKAKDFHKTVIYATEYAHHCLQKSVRICGLSETQWHVIPCDVHFRLDTQALKDAIEADRSSGLFPWLVIASAGTTDVGAIDPLDEIATICKENKLWFHVDAAYGGFFNLTEKGKERLKGIEKADSLVADPHKSLHVPYGVGAVLVRDKRWLLKANNYDANYMQDAHLHDEELSSADLSPELTKHFRALRLWLPLKIHGVQPFIDSLEEKMLLSEYCYQVMAKDSDFEVFNHPDLSVFTFRMTHDTIPLDELNERIQEEVMKDGRIFVSSTKLNGNYVLRMVVLSFRTHLSTIEMAIKVLKESKEKVVKDYLTPS